MYTIDFDAPTRTLHVTAAGFWSLGTLAAFSTTILAKCVAIKLRQGDFATLIDLRSFPVQAPEVARGVELLLGKAMKITTAPVATATGAQLLKLQAERVLKADHSRIFLTIEEAQDWLDECWIGAARAA